MMRYVLVFIFFSNLISAQSLSTLRGHLKNGVEGNSQLACEYLHKDAEKAFEKTKLPIYQAFFATSFFLKAKNSLNPINKLSFFKKGKSLLEDAVRKDQKQIEIRFLRYCIQENLPAFLQYKNNLEDDKAFILKNFDKISDDEVKIAVKQHFKI